LDESVPRAARLVTAGLDAIEVSSNVMLGYADSALPYVAVDRSRALADLLLHRVLTGEPGREAYFRPWPRRCARRWRRRSSSSVACAAPRPWRRSCARATPTSSP